MIWIALFVVVALNLVVVAAIFVAKFRRERRERRFAVVSARVTEELIPFLESDDAFATDGRTATIGDARIELPPPATLDGDAALDTMMSFIATIKGEGRDRLVAILDAAGYAQPPLRDLARGSALVRARAAMTLGGMKAKVARDALVEHFLHDSSPEVRIVSAEALGEIGDVPSVGLLLQAIREPTRYHELRIAAVLSRLGLDAVPALEDVLDDDDERIVLLALDILIDIGMVIDPAPVERALNHVSPEVRARAAELLGVCGAVDSIGALVVASSDREWFVRVRVVKALGRLGVPDNPDFVGEYFSVLQRALHDPVWYVRRHAASALATAGPDGRELLMIEASDVSLAALQMHELLGGAAPARLL